MREFTDFEKQIINKLASAEEIRDISLIKLIDENTDAIALEWNFDEPYFSFFYNNAKSTDNELYLLFYQIQEIIFLIKYLEENGLIYLHFNEKFSQDDWLYNRDKYIRDDDGNCYKVILNIIPKINSNTTGFLRISNRNRIHSDFGRFVKKYANALFYVSNSLRELVKNEYKTADQIRFDRQLKDAQEKHNESLRKAVYQIRIAWAAFITSIIAVIASWILGLFQLFIDLLISH